MHIYLHTIIYVHIDMCTWPTYKHTHPGWILDDTDAIPTMFSPIGNSGLREVVELDLCFKEWSMIFHPCLLDDAYPTQVSGLN